MILSDDFISEIKEKNDICEIISEYVDIQKKGRNMMGLCPFHAERTASFCVYPANGSFYCFGCGVGGDVITFLKLIEHYDYIEAVKYLAERAGMSFEVSEEDNLTYKKKLLIYEINRETAKYYYKCLIGKSGMKAREYLASRAVSSSMINRFGLGYSPDSRYSLIDYLKKRGYNVKDIMLSNLAFMSRSMKEIDRFSGRLMFPIIDVRGNIIAFGARSLSGEKPKYINTSDTLVFKKSSNLFALNFAVKSGSKNFILTEGYMDVIALHQAGFKNAVATLGTALTPFQAKLMSRHVEEVILSYDSDEAGQKASERAIKILRDNGLKVKIISMPNGKDPDEYLRLQGKNGSFKFNSLIEKSKNDIEFKLEKLRLLCDLNTSEGKIKYLTESAKILSQCKNSLEREVYALKISSEMGVNKEIISIQINKYIKQNQKRVIFKEFKNIEKNTAALNDDINKEKRNNLRAALAEENILSCVINNPDLANTIFSKVNENCFLTEFNKKVFMCLKDIQLKGGKLDINTISNYEFSVKEIGRITKIICTYKSYMGQDKYIDEAINILKQEKEKKKFQDIKNVSETEIQEYIKKMDKL